MGQIVDADVEIGYLHRGFEKNVGDGRLQRRHSLCDRLNYVSPLINNMGYCMAVEKLSASRPERCHYIR